MKWYQRLLQYPEVWLLSFLAFFTRLWQLGSPPSIVFDEVYFRSFAGNYLSGHYFFDIHPPLAKLLFAGVGVLFGLTAEQVTNNEATSLLLRITPAVAGAALIPLMYIIIRQFGFGRRLAVFGALLVLLDNALLVESRFVLMDSLLLLLGMGSLSVYLKARKSQGNVRWLWIVFLGGLLGSLVSIKWTGVAILGLLAGAWAVDASRMLHVRASKLIAEALTICAIILFIYISSFWLHFSLLPRSGDGDVFMSNQFQSSLIGSRFYDANTKLSFMDKFFELNAQMYTAQNSLKNTTHP